MSLNKEKIKKRFSEINESLTEIEHLVSLSDKEFWAEKEHMAAVKYYLLRAIEAVGSICVHIAAKKFNQGVSVFGECFGLLEKKNCLEKDLSSKLKKMVAFRNKLVHRYWEINDKKVLKYTREEINDFRDFIKAIDKIL